MTKRQTQWLLRILLGGGAGALLVLALWGPLFIGGYSIPPACQRLMAALGLPGAVGVTLALAFGFGAAVGVACWSSPWGWSPAGSPCGSCCSRRSTW